METSAARGNNGKPQPCRAAQQSVRQLLLLGARAQLVPNPVRQPHSKAVSTRQQHSNQAMRPIIVWLCTQLPPVAGQVAAAVAAHGLRGLFAA